MRRKLTLPVWPPVAMITPLRAAMLTGVAAVDSGDAEHPAGIVLLAHDRRHLVLEEDLRALLARAFLQPAHQAGAVAVSPRRDHLARDVPFLGDEDAIDRRGIRRADRLLDELDAVLDQEIVGRDVLVGENAHQVAVAEPALAVVVAHPVVEHLVGRVLDVQFLLQGVAAAELDPAAAQHAAAADVEVLVDHDDRGAVVARRDGGGQSGDARADHDHVGGVVPSDVAVGLGARLLSPPAIATAPTPAAAPCARNLRLLTFLRRCRRRLSASPWPDLPDVCFGC